MENNKAPFSILLKKEAVDSEVREAIDNITETGEVMGLGFSSLIDIFDPEKFILGKLYRVVGDLLPATKDNGKML